MSFYGWNDEDIELVRSSFKKFCDQELTREYVRWMDENCDFVPDDLWRKLVDMGWMARNVPKEYGGQQEEDITPYAGLVCAEELATASVAVSLGVGAATGFGIGFINALGNEDQRKEYLPRLASGELKMCMALTEPGGGTDIFNALRTTAVPDGNDFVINGQKVFISAAHVADYIVTIARTNMNPPRRSEAFSIFLVDAKSPGITVRLIPKLGIKACGCCEIFYEDVRVPKENLLGPLHKGYLYFLGGLGDAVRRGGMLNSERLGTAMLSLGIAKAAYKDAYDYSLQREAFGKPIAAFQVIQHYLVEMAIQIENARNLIYRCHSLALMGKPSHVEAQMAKVVAARASEYCAIKGMEILGGYGFTMEYDMQRHFRDYKQMVFAPVTDEMALNTIGRLLGLPRCY
jgi:alkylation response protein AidB-like acyl-CoA dehydrogenase